MARTLHRIQRSFAIIQVSPISSFHQVHYFSSRSPVRDAKLPHANTDDNEDFFRTTEYRHLWNEEAILQKRYKRFNVAELKRAAADSVGAKHCVSMEKLPEGGSNRPFRLVMDDGSVVIARIPLPGTAPAFKGIASEVATLDFVQTVLDIPVPRVPSWDGNADNPVGSEYILMEEAKGKWLYELWSKMDPTEKSRIVDGIVAIQKKLLSVSFNMYGSLYFAEDAFSGCQQVELQGDIPQPLKHDVKSRFVIGPVAYNDFWYKERAMMNLDRGPWKRPEAYLQAIAHREIAWLRAHASHPQNLPGFPFPRSKSQNQPLKHIALHEAFLQLTDHILPTTPALVRPTLWYADWRTPNIFISSDDGNNTISSVIDWQNIWAAPLFLTARVPSMLQYKGDLELELPDDFPEMDGEEKKVVVSRVERSLLLYSYYLQTSRQNPELHKIFGRLVEEGGDVVQKMVLCAENTWEDDVAMFRNLLLKVTDSFRPSTSTTIPSSSALSLPEFSPSTIQEHLDYAETYNAEADLWSELRELRVGRDGSVPHAAYDAVKEMLEEGKKIGLLDPKIESEKDEEEIRELERLTRWMVEGGK